MASEYNKTYPRAIITVLLLILEFPTVACALSDNAIRLTATDWEETAPSFSPDGTKVVFNSRRSGNSDIWIMDANGSNQRLLQSRWKVHHF